MAATQPPPQSRSFNNGYLPNGAPPGGPSGPVPGAQPLLPNQGRVFEANATRILCVADIRGHLSTLNDLARTARADCIIHTGDFGFYDDRSLDRIAEKTLKHVAQYSPLISDDVRRQVVSAPVNSLSKQRFSPQQLPLSQFPAFLSGALRFDVPVYSVWGACEDVQVLEKIRSNEYKVPNLHILDEENSRRLEVGGVKLRLLGLGGAVVMHKLFDNGEGRTTIAGGQGTMWTTFLQMGMLIGTANAAYDPSETRVLVTHASPSREGLLNQLAVHLKVDFSISAGLHFRYGSSYNEFSVNPGFDHYRGKLAASKSSFNDVWETVKGEVEPVVASDDTQLKCLQNALSVVDAMPSVANSGGPFGGQSGGALGDVESAFKNLWNFNLSDAAFGHMVLEVDGGRVAAEMKSQGFNFGHRGVKSTGAPPEQAKGNVASPAPPSYNEKPPLPAQAPSQQPQPRAQVPPSNTSNQPQQPPLQNRPNQGPRSQQSQQPPISRTQPTSSGAPTQAQQIQPAPSTKASAPAQPSPASPAPQTNQNRKPSATNGVNDKTNAAEPKVDGTSDASAGAKQAAPSPTPVEKKPSKSVYISGTHTEEEVRSFFLESDRSKIERIDTKSHFSVAHFRTPEEMQAAYDAIPSENRKSAKNPGKPMIKVYEDRRNTNASGNWGNNNRGGQQGGYRSGGASDSEGGRGGRGGFRGSRGGRGNYERGRGGRGRGGANKSTQGESSSPAPVPSASEATGHNW